MWVFIMIANYTRDSSFALVRLVANYKQRRHRYAALVGSVALILTIVCSAVRCHHHPCTYFLYLNNVLMPRTSWAGGGVGACGDLAQLGLVATRCTRQLMPYIYVIT